MVSYEYPNENLLPAFLLVLVAGASTGIGAAVVFFPSIVKLANKEVLAGSLGFSAGVMTYISFVEIIWKANDSFINAGHAENFAYIYTVLTFFSGILIMVGLNLIIDKLHGKKHSHSLPEPKKKTKKKKAKKKTHKTTRESVNKELKKTDPWGCNVWGCTDPCCSADPARQLENLQKMASVLKHEAEDATNAATNDVVDEEDITEENDPNEEEDEANVMVTDTPEPESEQLQHMGLKTAIAIGLHNFPEGLATFVAAVQDPKVGAVLALGIALHNIPEGLCVALPIYYGSGIRIKGFIWGLLSGASEFVAAFLGWLILANVFSETAYAVLFGLVAGMMIIISVKELLPTAHKYDKHDSVVSYSFIVGMAVMALSLCLFQI